MALQSARGVRGLDAFSLSPGLHARGFSAPRSTREDPRSLSLGILAPSVPRNATVAPTPVGFDMPPRARAIGAARAPGALPRYHAASLARHGVTLPPRSGARTMGKRSEPCCAAWQGAPTRTRIGHRHGAQLGAARCGACGRARRAHRRTLRPDGTCETTRQARRRTLRSSRATLARGAGRAPIVTLAPYHRTA